jgi:hypothetical protein
MGIFDWLFGRDEDELDWPRHYPPPLPAKRDISGDLGGGPPPSLHEPGRDVSAGLQG